MKKRFLQGFSFFLVASIGLVSCNDSKTDLDLDLDETADTTKMEQTNEPAISYSVPTPNDLFEIIKAVGGELDMSLINSVENKDKYVDLKSKALNFGVYSADLGYMSCFDNGIEFLKYTKAVEDLAGDLGISEVFDKTLLDRIEENEENYDSLFNISSQTYYESYAYLEENKKGQELSLIIIGGYIESVYIISNLIENFDENSEIVEKLGDQHLVLGQIIDFCAQYADIEAVSEALSDIIKLQSVFEENMDYMEGTNANGSNVSNDNDIPTFASGGSYRMNQKTYDAVKSEITELRNKITQK
ncbi:MAG: hypothetical protein R3279_07930 [Putridiphycobacter sp.]|jgi:hypothetical protein|nr:hypothetical protein [Putridiphycobacter sp.]